MRESDFGRIDVKTNSCVDSCVCFCRCQSSLINSSSSLPVSIVFCRCQSSLINSSSSLPVSIVFWFSFKPFFEVGAPSLKHLSYNHPSFSVHVSAKSEQAHFPNSRVFTREAGSRMGHIRTEYLLPFSSSLGKREA